MGQLKDILEGHVNEMLGNNEQLFKQRMEICKKCPLYLNTIAGPVCNAKLWISTADGQTVSRSPKVGYRKGCNCRLNSKTRVLNAQCVVNK